MAEHARVRLIEKTLASTIARQGAKDTATLDLSRLAVEVEAALAREKPFQLLDPEGDGLESSELNAANDV